MNKKHQVKGLIRNVIREALGVPENIYETANEVFQKFSNSLKKIDSKEPIEPGLYNFNVKGTFRISDFTFSTVKINVKIEENEKFNQPELISMAVTSESKKTKDFKLKLLKYKTINLNIFIIVPENYDNNELYQFLQDNKKEFIVSFTHELKHAYDHYKKIFDNPKQRALYNAVSGRGFGIEPIDLFFHDIYFTLATENLVRPSEVVAAIKNNEISQKDFLDFLKSNDTYKNLKRISNFTFEKLKEELKNHMERIDELLYHMNFPVSESTEDEKINEVLRLIMVNVGNWSIESFKDIITTSMVEEIFGFSGEKEKIFRRFYERQRRFKNPEEFFGFYEKQFHYVADNMLRKIAKLYAITQPE